VLVVILLDDNDDDDDDDVVMMMGKSLFALMTVIMYINIVCYI